MTILLGKLLTLGTAALAAQGNVGPPRQHADADPFAALDPFVPANEERHGAKFDEADSLDELHSDSDDENPTRNMCFAKTLRPELVVGMTHDELIEFELWAHEHFNDRIRRGLVTDSRGLRFSRGEIALANARRDATLVDPATQRDLHADSDEPDGAAFARALSTAWEG